MKTPPNIRQAFFSICKRCLLFIILAWLVYAAWHQHFGPFMFFEQMDPPGADPHRTQHLRDAYFLVYGSLGVLLGVVSSTGADMRSALITTTLGTFVFFVVRYRGIPEFFDPHSEEGYFGGPALLLSATTSTALVSVLRRVIFLRHIQKTTQ